MPRSRTFTINDDEGFTTTFNWPKGATTEYVDACVKAHMLARQQYGLDPAGSPLEPYRRGPLTYKRSSFWSRHLQTIPPPFIDAPDPSDPGNSDAQQADLFGGFGYP